MNNLRFAQDHRDAEITVRAFTSESVNRGFNVTLRPIPVSICIAKLPELRSLIPSKWERLINLLSRNRSGSYAAVVSN